MSNVIQFRSSNIPFSRADLCEIAERLGASAPEILDAAGGSVVLLAFLDYLAALAALGGAVEGVI